MAERAPQRKRLTKKQKALVKAVVMDPNATLRDWGETSGYKNAASTHRALKAPAVVDALVEVRGIMSQRDKLSLGTLMTRLEEGLEATRPVSLKVDGEDMLVSAEVKDFAVRHKYWTDAMKLHGALRPEAEAGPSQVTNIAIIMAGGGSEQDKSNMAEALMASRVVRGLHPTENRALTQEEAQAYGR